jgi:tetratricopeptide (TPR) repeat protein
MARSVAGGLALTLALAMSASAETPSADSWIAARGPHFTVVTDAPAGHAAHLVRRFERLRAVFARLWPTARTDAKSVIVIAPATRAGLRSLLPAEWSLEDAMHPAGLMVAGLDRVYLGVPLGASDSADGVATHEYVHLLVEANIPAAPLWLNEGLAEFFAAGRFDESPAVFGVPHAGHLLVLRTQPWLPLSTLLSAMRGAKCVRDRETSAAFYAQAWALVHYLKLGDGGRHAATLTAFSAQLAQGVPADAVVEAFGDPASLERRLRNYVNGERFFDARLPAPVAAEADPVERAPAWDAVLLLGDFLTHVAHHEEAARLLAHAAAMAPASAAVCERQALLAFQRQDFSAALERADRALALDASRALAHYLRAVTLLAAGTTLTVGSTRDAELSLRRAIAVSPTLAPAYTTLGGLLAARDGASLEALALIQRAIALDPSAVGGNAAEASRVAERARAAARTTTERETVERLLAAARQRRR